MENEIRRKKVWNYYWWEVVDKKTILIKILMNYISLLIEDQFQFSSVPLSCQTVCDPMDCSTPGLPSITNSWITQTHAHQVGDALQPSHLLSSPSPLAFNLSQHQGLFQWVCSLHQVAKVLELQLQHQPSALPMNIQDWFPLGLIGLISLQFKGLSRVFSSTTVQQHQFFGSQFSL